MEKKYTMDEFNQMFIKAQIEVFDEIFSDDTTKFIKQNNNISDEEIRLFQQNQMITAILYTSKLYRKLFKE